MASTPTQGIAGAISSTLFPEYRNIHEDDRASYTTGAVVVSTVFATLMLGVMSALATPEVNLFLGRQWMSTIPMLVALTIALVTLVPQWTLSLASQALLGFGAQKSSRLTMLVGGIAGAVGVAISGNVYIGIAAIGALQGAGHAVDIYAAGRSNMVQVGKLLKCYARTLAATLPLFTIGLLQGARLWSIVTPTDYILLALLTLVTAVFAARILLCGSTRKAAEDLGLVPAWKWPSNA